MVKNMALNEQYPWLYDQALHHNYGTSDGVKKAWDTRGRGRNEDAPAGKIRIPIMGVKLVQVEPTKFLEQRSKMPADKMAFHSTYTPEDYEKMGAETYLSESGNAGFALKPVENGKEGITLFSLPGAHEGDNMIKACIAMGMTQLDCIGPFLKTKYESYGFKVVGKDDWNDDYAPPNWNYEKYGRPPIFYMKLDKGAEGVKANAEENMVDRNIDIPAEAYKKKARVEPKSDDGACSAEQLANLKRAAEEMFD